MATSSQLIKGAYGAAGGGVDGLGLQASRGLRNISTNLWEDKFKPVWEKRSRDFNLWAQQDLQERFNQGGLDNKGFKNLNNTYQIKKFRFLMGDQAMRDQLMREIVHDKAELEKVKRNQKEVIDATNPNNEGGLNKNPEFTGGKVGNSVVKALSAPPIRNSKNQLGYMIYDPQYGKERFYNTGEFTQLIQDNSFDEVSQAKIDGLGAVSINESLSLPFKANLYNYDQNWRLIKADIVDKGNLKSLNEMNTAGPDMTFHKAFVEMLLNNNYENLAITPPGEDSDDYIGEHKLRDFAGLGRRDIKRLQRRINATHKKYGDDDMTKISPEDAEAIYQALTRDEKLNKEYLTTYLANWGEKNWMKARWSRKDAPSRFESSQQGDGKAGIDKSISAMENAYKGKELSGDDYNRDIELFRGAYGDDATKNLILNLKGEKNYENITIDGVSLARLLKEEPDPEKRKQIIEKYGNVKPTMSGNDTYEGGDITF